MLRGSHWRLPVAVTAAGILLCGCASAATVGSPATVPAAGPSTTVAVTPAPGSPSVPPDANAPVPPQATSAPAVTHAPAAVVPAPSTPVVPEMTATAWADLLASGTVTPTAAAPSVADSVAGVPLSLPRARAAAPVRPVAPVAPAARQKVVYLTFDDGPGQYTPQVLRLLDQYDAKATFFVIGKQVAHAKKTLRTEYAKGHGVANHTWDHDSLVGKNPRQFNREVARTSVAIEKAIGHAPVCLRPPGGAKDKNTRPRAKAYGMRLAMWDIDTYDWKRPGTKTIAHRASTARDGSIVLMHDGGGNRKQTVAALGKILHDLKAKGFVFKAMCR